MSTLTFGALRQANDTRQMEWPGNDRADIAFRALEVAGETGELSEAVKKFLRAERGIKGSTATPADVADEMADCLIALDLLASQMGIDLSEAVARKFNKTSAKYGMATRLPEQAQEGTEKMKLAYADPPYPGCADLYRDHPDYAGEVYHRELVERLQDEYDGWVLHTHVPGLRMMEREHILPEDGIRICQWVKPFAAFKRNIPVGYASEPVIVKAARKPVVSKRITPLRDFLQGETVRENIAMKKGLTGAKPEAVVHWALEVMAARPDDEFHDLYPGTGAVEKAWRSWCGKFTLPQDAA